MNLNDVLKTRYATKKFDPLKKIDDSLWKDVEEALHLSPSSTNIQPWHFFVASTDEGKKRLAKGTKKYAFNNSKILDASHVVLFCAKTEISDDYLLELLELEDKHGRFASKEAKEQYHENVRTFFVDLHRSQLSDLGHWTEKQLYLNMGNALLGAAFLGIDAVPMEGIDTETLDREFNLQEQGLHAVAIVSFGYRAEDDYNSKLPKSRKDLESILTRI